MFVGFFQFPALELIRFAIIGGTATFIHALCGYIAVDTFGFNGLPANAIGFGCAWWVSFFGHHLFTFKGRADPYKAFFKFVLHSLAMFLVALSVAAIVSQIFSFITENFVPVIGALIVPLISFVSSKFFVFQKDT